MAIFFKNKYTLYGTIIIIIIIIYIHSVRRVKSYVKFFFAIAIVFWQLILKMFL